MLSETFMAKKDAEAWARRIESEIDNGKTPARKDVAGVKTFGALIDLHIEDMKEVGKPLGRSKAYSLDLLKNRLGLVRLENLDRERIIQFGKARAVEGAGPVTLSIDIGFITTLLTHGAAIHGLPLSPEQVSLARTALKRLGLVGKGDGLGRAGGKDYLPGNGADCFSNFLPRQIQNCCSLPPSNMRRRCISWHFPSVNHRRQDFRGDFSRGKIVEIYWRHLRLQRLSAGCEENQNAGRYLAPFDGLLSRLDCSDLIRGRLPDT